MGKRRKRNDRSVEGEVEYFYPIKNRENSRILKGIPDKLYNKSEIIPASTNIDDNVGVTVIMPGGKKLLIFISFYRTCVKSNQRKKLVVKGQKSIRNAQSKEEQPKTEHQKNPCENLNFLIL